jgi:hypothetical protein
MPPRFERTDDRVDRLLQARDPVDAGALATEAIESAVDEIAAAITSQPRTRRASRRRRLTGPRSIALAGAIVVLAAGGAAAATHFLTAYTGRYPTKKWEIEAGGPGQYLRVAGANFCQVALKLSSDISYPPGYANWRPWVLVTEADVPHVTLNGPCGSENQSGRAVDSSGELHGWFAMSAFCAWVYDWRAAKLDRDSVAATRAASVIAGAPRWKAVVAEDPHPSAALLSDPNLNLTGSRGRTTSLFGWFLPFRTAVLSGNVTRVQQLISTNYGTAGCSYFKPLAGSHGGTMLPARFQHTTRSGS